MNILLWVLQVALALFCIAGGGYKIAQFTELQKTLASMKALPQGLWVFFGAFEVLAGLGLVLPAALKMQPTLSAYSAVVVAIESVLISAIYIYYGDYAPMMFTAFMALVAAFIAYGRFTLKPF